MQRLAGARTTQAHPVGRLQRLPEATVAALVARAKLGDREAFAHLFEHYVNDVYAFVAVRLRDRDAAQDMTQTIFLRALQSLGTCRENAAFPGWLFAIARNCVADHYRGRRVPTGPIVEMLEYPDPEPTPEEMALRRDDEWTLRDAREHCLSPREQELFDLILTGMNDKQIGVVLGRSHGAVRSAHHRLVQALRECLRRRREERAVRHATN